MNDSEIISLLNDRDETAVAAINERFGRLCRGIASNILPDARDVEECVSSVYFKLWKSIPPAEPKDLTAYVAKAARNEALTRWRSNNAKGKGAILVPIEELEPCLAGASAADDEPQARALAEATEAFVRRLPKEKRGVFMRRYWFFDDARTIAGIFGITEKRVNSILAVTRRELRRYLIKEGFINEQ